MAKATCARQTKGRPDESLFNCELDHFPPETRCRVEATIFAASEPGARETLARILGKSCSIALLIESVREELRGRPYDLVAVAGDWKHQTRPIYIDAIRSTFGTAVGENSARTT